MKFNMPDLEPSGLSTDDVSEGDTLYAPTLRHTGRGRRPLPEIRVYDVVAVHSREEKFLVEWTDNDIWHPEKHQLWMEADELYADQARAEELAREVCVEDIKQLYHEKIDSKRSSIQKLVSERNEWIRQTIGGEAEDQSEFDILPCPCCGSTDVGDHHREIQRYTHAVYWVSCADCGIRTRNHGDREDAISEWNKTEWGGEEEDDD